MSMAAAPVAEASSSSSPTTPSRSRLSNPKRLVINVPAPVIVVKDDRSYIQYPIIRCEGGRTYIPHIDLVRKLAKYPQSAGAPPRSPLSPISPRRTAGFHPYSQAGRASPCVSPSADVTMFSPSATQFKFNTTPYDMHAPTSANDMDNLRLPPLLSLPMDFSKKIFKPRGSNGKEHHGGYNVQTVLTTTEPIWSHDDFNTLKNYINSLVDEKLDLSVCLSSQHKEHVQEIREMTKNRFYPRLECYTENCWPITNIIAMRLKYKSQQLRNKEKEKEKKKQEREQEELQIEKDAIKELM